MRGLRRQGQEKGASGATFEKIQDGGSQRSRFHGVNSFHFNPIKRLQWGPQSREPREHSKNLSETQGPRYVYILYSN